jgi:hypothetical protein
MTAAARSSPQRGGLKGSAPGSGAGVTYRLGVPPATGDGHAGGGSTSDGSTSGGSTSDGSTSDGKRASARAAAMLAGLCTALVAAGCASPSPSYPDYRGKVQQTATAMISAVATGQLAAGLLVAGRSTGTFTDAVVTDAEKDADSAQTALDSRQPPDARSIALKQQADQAVQSAVTGLTDLRIAVRRDDIPGIRRADAELAKVLPQLERFAS